MQQQMEVQMQQQAEAQRHAQQQLQAVVKFFVRAVDTSYSSPWQKMDAAVSTGSGFSIGDGRILTNAHVVHNAVSVRVQRPGQPGPHVRRQPAAFGRLAFDDRRPHRVGEPIGVLADRPRAGGQRHPPLRPPVRAACTRRRAAQRREGELSAGRAAIESPAPFAAHVRVDWSVRGVAALPPFAHGSL